MDSIPKVFLWSTPRSLSTAFERSIRTLKNGKVFHNPFRDARYVGPDRTVSEFAEFGVSSEELFGTAQPNPSYKEVIATMSPPYEGCAFVFANVTPHFVEDRLEQIIFHESFNNFMHTFLIRDPFKMVPSHYLMLLNIFGRNYLSPNRGEYRQLFQVYDIVKKLDTKPVVIDADDLLENPEEMMRLYCEQTNLPYDENMTKWEPGMVEDWKKCAQGNHAAVIKSSGFIRKQKDDGKYSKSDLYYENDVVRRVTDESLPYYNALYEQRLRLH